MPELPEVETVRRGLERSIAGRRIVGVRVLRAGVVEGAPGECGGRAGAALLEGLFVRAVLRRGKQLAIEGSAARDRHSGDRAIGVHLGMTGQLMVVGGAEASAEPLIAHTHVVWALDSGQALVFRDPRRFGGVWTFPSLEALRAARWADLGPDAHDDPAGTLSALLGARESSRRAIKAALLDQSLLAGVGNIYADESLHRAGIDPRRACRTLKDRECEALAAAIGEVLGEAVEAGGSTLRDYRSADGSRGEFQAVHRVYGRAGLPCLACDTPLRRATIGQRTTVWCPRCQPARPSRGGRPGPLPNLVIHIGDKSGVRAGL